MIWYENLYLGERFPKKEAKIRRIKWKIKHNRCFSNVFLIVLCRCGPNLLEILPAKQLCQKHYPRQGLYVVGLAKDYEDALWTAARIVMDVYEKTGGFEVKRYILRQKAGEVT